MSRSVPNRRSATYEDLLAVPGHLVAEILDGELHTSPRPGVSNALATTGLGGDLIGHNPSQSLWLSPPARA